MIPKPLDLLQRSAVTALALAVAGCSAVNSTTKRSGAVALGAGAGGAAAYALGAQKPAEMIAGAAAGGAITHLALGSDPVIRQEGFDLGYVQGQSDAIKRQYFLRQALEAEPLAKDARQGEPVYYVLPGTEVTADGRRLEPHTVAVRVIE